jgi:cytochrome bd-type quinol oxidase subunit 1
MIVMMEGISIIALALIAIVAYTYKKGKKIKINKIMFAVGLIIALVAALMEFCQERCFLRVDLESRPTVLGIVGIGIIATSGIIATNTTTGVKKKK